MRATLLLPCAALLALGGCATSSPQDSAAAVAALVQERTGVTPRLSGPQDGPAAAAVTQEVDALLKAAVSMEAAVRIACSITRACRPPIGKPA